MTAASIRINRPFHSHVYKMFFLCEIIGGKATRNDEIDEIGLFARDVIPPLSLTRITPQLIDRMFEHQQHADWPADFD